MDKKLHTNTKSRAPKLLGDFGEGLVAYALIRKGFEVACVDHVGADLIAQRDLHRIAVSVKTRRYRSASVETRGTVIELSHIEKLEHFADRFALEPIFAHTVCVEDDKTIHLFMIRVADIRKYLDKVEHGCRLRFSEQHLPMTIALPYVDYSSWSNESIGSKLFGIDPENCGNT
jgi:Holliday junction resolvase